MGSYECFCREGFFLSDNQHTCIQRPEGQCAASPAMPGRVGQVCPHRPRPHGAWLWVLVLDPSRCANLLGAHRERMLWG